jgi:predicted GNAT family acetyltransferase
VEADFRGRGIGNTLLKQLIDDVRKAKLSVLPLCPFASAAIAKDASLQDVLSMSKT